MTYDLRTPITQILNCSEKLQEAAEEQGAIKAVTDLKAIHAAGEQLLRLVNVNGPPEPNTGSTWEASLTWLRDEARTPLDIILSHSVKLHGSAGGLGHADYLADLQKISSAAHALLAMVGDSGTLAPASATEGASPPVPSREVIRQREKGANLAPAEAEVGSRHRTGGGGFVLLIDDDQLDRQRLASSLEQEGHRVTVAENGYQALNLMKENNFDLALIDIMMPEMDGFQILKRLKGDETLRHIPVIVLSATDEVDGAVKCIEMGAEDYLLKPFDPVLLRARINAGVERKRLRDQELTYLQQIEEGDRRSNELLNLILPLGIALSSETNFNRLAERILVEAKSICRADGGTLYLRTEDDCLKFGIMYNDSLNIALGGTTRKEVPLPPLRLYDENTGEPNHRNVAAFAALEGRSVNLPDAYKSQEFDFSGLREFDRAHNYRTTSILSVPLKDHHYRVIGEIQLINAQDPKTHEVMPFDPYLQEVVECLASQIAVALNNELLRQRQTELTKFEDELRIGRKIQADFLPSEQLNQVLTQELWQPDGWEIAAYFSPARQVAGDFYDVFPLSGSHVGLVIADVCDKGVSAALFMALIRSLIRAFSGQTLQGLPILASAQNASTNSIRRQLVTLLADLNALNTVVLTNNYIASTHNRSNMFATLFFGVLDPDTGLLTYVNGGHESPVILGPAGMKGRLEPTGPAVGMLPDMEFEIGQAHLEPGDLLFSYTDGVPDSRNPKGELFTDTRLLSLLKEQSWPSAGALLSQVETSVLTHVAGASQFDDITLLAVRRLPTIREGSEELE